jgi:single-strand DNA-binding protein
MRDFNKAIVLGNLTKDPEVKAIPSGQQVASFGVATNRRWADANGNKQEETEFHDIVAWGKLAEICEKILSKGQKVLVEGRIKTRNWEGQDGVKRYKTEIIAENVLAVGPGKGYDSGSSSASYNLPEESKGESEPKKAENGKNEKTDDKKPAAKKTDKEENIDDILDDFPF